MTDEVFSLICHEKSIKKNANFLSCFLLCFLLCVLAEIKSLAIVVC